MPNPVRPLTSPSFKSPVNAVVASPEPMAPAAAELNPAAPNTPAPAPVNAADPSILPIIGAKNGRNASGCPVIGLVVRPPGTKDAMP